METIISGFIFLHAVSGFAALLSGGISMATAKGGKTHRIAGKIYFAGMTGIFVTATFISIVKGLPFLLMVGFFSYQMVCSGYRALFLKKLHLRQRAAFIDWFMAIIAGLFNISLCIWGVHAFLEGGNSLGIVALVFGVTGIQFIYRDLKKFIITPEDKNHWLFSHIGGMAGGYIATWTAFMVVNINFLPALVCWLLPTAIGVPLILLNIRKYKTLKASVA